MVHPREENNPLLKECTLFNQYPNNMIIKREILKSIENNFKIRKSVLDARVEIKKAISIFANASLPSVREA